MIKTRSATILQSDGSIETVRVIRYDLPCGSVGHALSLRRAKKVWEIHVKNCPVCKEHFTDVRCRQVTTDGSDARSLVYVHNRQKP